LLALPNVDEDKTFAVEIAHEENALSAGTCCMQAALLYTTSSGERRIRVHTVQLPVTSGLNALYEAADVDACTNLLGRVALDSAMNGKLLDGAEKLQNSCLEMLRAYRSLCPPHAKSMSTLLLPESLKLLPLYVLGLMKGPLFSQDMRPDDRSHAFYAYSTMPVAHSTVLSHPRLLQVHPPLQQVNAATTDVLPPLLSLSATSLASDGVFLIEDGFYITLWLGKATPTEFLQQAFGWPSLEGVDATALRLLPSDSTPLSGYLHKVCELLGAARAGSWLSLRVMKQGEGDGTVMRALIEDQTRQMMAYTEFLTHCHRYILSKVA